MLIDIHAATAPVPKATQRRRGGFGPAAPFGDGHSSIGIPYLRPCVAVALAKQSAMKVSFSAALRAGLTCSAWASQALRFFLRQPKPVSSALLEPERRRPRRSSQISVSSHTSSNLLLGGDYSAVASAGALLQ
jgi:hypothetical protein